MVESEVKNKVENTTSNPTGKDITYEVEPEKGEVEIYSIEALAPSSIPINVPYLEIYRTNELEYIPYISPYNTGVQSSSDSEDSSSTDTTNTDETNTDGTTNTDGSSTSGSASTTST